MSRRALKGLRNGVSKALDVIVANSPFPHSLGFLLKVGEEWFWKKKLVAPKSLNYLITALSEARAEYYWDGRGVAV